MKYTISTGNYKSLADVYELDLPGTSYDLLRRMLSEIMLRHIDFTVFPITITIEESV